MDLTVIVPCYNEKDTIETILERVRATGLAREIIVVDDGSTDGTREILQNMPPADDLRIFYHASNQGKGAAVRTGIAAVQTEIFLIQDADLEYDPRDYPVLLQPIHEGRAKVVYGSRFLGGPRTAMKFWNAVANRLLAFTTNILYDAILCEMETCFKVVLTELVRPIPLHARSFEFEPEITAKVLKRGVRIYEVPISYTGRETWEGKKIRWTDGPIALWTLIKYRFVD